MLSIRIMIKLVSLSLLAASLKCCYADGFIYPDAAYTCDPRADNSTTAAFEANLNSLLTTLKEKGPENYGFYMATTDKNSDKIYGLVQCMGDLSAQDCASCLKDSVKWARTNCKNSNDVAIWLHKCFLRYSDGIFLGQWNTSMKALIPSNSSSADSPFVALRGHDLMRRLSLDVPNQPFLFKTGSVDFGKKGKRYGLAQCNRDLNVSSCSNCIEDMLDSEWIGNQSSYMMFTCGCRMWYDTYKFYFNDTVPSIAPNDAALPTASMHLQISFISTVAALVSILVS